MATVDMEYEAELELKRASISEVPLSRILDFQDEEQWPHVDFEHESTSSLRSVRRAKAKDIRKASQPQPGDFWRSMYVCRFPDEDYDRCPHTTKAPDYTLNWRHPFDFYRYTTVTGKPPSFDPVNSDVDRAILGQFPYMRYRNSLVRAFDVRSYDIFEKEECFPREMLRRMQQAAIRARGDILLMLTSPCVAAPLDTNGCRTKLLLQLQDRHLQELSSQEVVGVFNTKLVDDKEYRPTLFRPDFSMRAAAAAAQMDLD